MTKITKKSHYIPDYTVKGSQAAEYDVGYSVIPDLYRDKSISGIGDMSDRVRRIQQTQKRKVLADNKTSRAKRFAQANNLPLECQGNVSEIISSLSSIHQLAYNLKNELRDDEVLGKKEQQKIKLAEEILFNICGKVLDGD